MGNPEAPLIKFSAKDIDLIKRTQMPTGGTDDDLQLLLYFAEKTSLNPLLRQVYLSKRRGKATVQATIDGFRLAAERTGQYGGQTTPVFCGEDGKWTDAWTSSKPPVLAKVGILRKGFDKPVYGIARYASYMQKDRDGKLLDTWSRMPETMLAKVAEALGFRKTFPDLLSGLYTDEEMAQIPSGDPEEPAPESQSSGGHKESTPAEASPTPPPAGTPDKAQPGEGGITDNQIQRLWAMAKSLEMSVDDLTAKCNTVLDTKFSTPREMTSDQTEKVIEELSKLAQTA